jgi:transposase
MAGGGESDEKTTGNSGSDSRRIGSVRSPVSNNARCATTNADSNRAVSWRAAHDSTSQCQIVREDDQTVRNWLKRYLAEGIEGLKDRPMPGAPPKVTKAYTEQLLFAVRRRPRSLEQPYSMWTLQRLADYMAQQTGIRVSDETVRKLLKAGEIVLSRPQHKISSPDPEYLVKKDD